VTGFASLNLLSPIEVTIMKKFIHVLLKALSAFAI